ncbi:IclR family transcriptional regulator [Tersicoccus sp. Bi-70]|uniref:IclR family transcriptional regulator n=1 Tax=Tersicoccus sp. Bi-70 TaxID=1897634 RepID=UPI0009F84274|nr:helix-turn-helix domain-containing protein [Tersicoccus sp. Bi-70]
MAEDDGDAGTGGSTDAGDSTRRTHHRTVDRVVRILELVVAVPDGATLTELARELTAPVSSVQKLVNGLVATGYVTESNHRFTLGPAVFYLTHRAAARPPVLSVRHADLERLRAETGASAILAVRVGAESVYMDWASTDEAFSFQISMQSRAHLTETAVGRVLLAHLEPGERRRIVAAHLPPEEAVRMLDRLAGIRESGYELGFSGARLPEARAIAVPVLEGGHAVAAVSLTNHRSSVSDRALTAHRRLLRAEAERWAQR